MDARHIVYVETSIPSFYSLRTDPESIARMLRPPDAATLAALVATYAAGANAHQRQMFADSLHAALSLLEIQELVAELGFAKESVQATSDRHWTWAARKCR